MLYDPQVELPSDFGGILYLPLDAADSWRERLAAELLAMGVEIEPDT